MTALAWVAVAALGGAMAIARFLVDTSVATRPAPVGSAAASRSAPWR